MLLKNFQNILYLPQIPFHKVTLKSIFLEFSYIQQFKLIEYLYHEFTNRSPSFLKDQKHLFLFRFQFIFWKTNCVSFPILKLLLGRIKIVNQVVQIQAFQDLKHFLPSLPLRLIAPYLIEIPLVRKCLPFSESIDQILPQEYSQTHLEVAGELSYNDPNICFELWDDQPKHLREDLLGNETFKIAMDENNNKELVALAEVEPLRKLEMRESRTR